MPTKTLVAILVFGSMSYPRPEGWIMSRSMLNQLILNPEGYVSIVTQHYMLIIAFWYYAVSNNNMITVILGFSFLSFSSSNWCLKDLLIWKISFWPMESITYSYITPIFIQYITIFSRLRLFCGPWNCCKVMSKSFVGDALWPQISDLQISATHDLNEINWILWWMTQDMINRSAHCECCKSTNHSIIHLDGDG